MLQSTISLQKKLHRNSQLKSQQTLPFLIALKAEMRKDKVNKRILEKSTMKMM